MGCIKTNWRKETKYRLFHSSEGRARREETAIFLLLQGPRKNYSSVAYVIINNFLELIEIGWYSFLVTAITTREADKTNNISL